MRLRSSTKNLSAGASVDDRPRTRQRVREQEQLENQRLLTNKHEEDRTVSTVQPPRSRGKQSKVNRPTAARTHPKDPIPSTGRRIVTRSQSTALLLKDNSELPALSLRQPRTQNASVDHWLDNVNNSTNQDLTGIPLTMAVDNSSTPSGISTETSEASFGPLSTATTEKTARPAQKQRCGVTWDSLRMRQVDQIATDDHLARHFASILLPKQIRIKFKDTEELQVILRDFLRLCEQAKPNHDSYGALEDLINEIARWKPQHHLFAVSQKEFQSDIQLCKGSNEAVLQRTIMTSLIDRWQLSEIFTFNCEGQWVTRDYPLPTTGRTEKISVPKPDLAVFFRFEKLASKISVALPAALNECLRPDGGQWRCFPFLFIEAKKSDHSLSPAAMVNAHSASQALYNIYIWMSLADEADDFFARVRVFTIELNARELALRCHRAALDDDGQIRFQHHEVLSQQVYNRDDACMLIKNILNEYGNLELHKILRNTFQKVTAAYASGQLDFSDGRRSKRKATQSSEVSNERSRGPARVAGAIDVATSFGASNLSLTSTNA